MAVAVTVTSVDNTQKQFIVDGTLTLSGDYVAHGDTIDLTGFDFIKTESPAILIEIWEKPAAGVSASGYVLEGIPGTALNNNVLQVFEVPAATGDAQDAAPLAELAAGAYPAGLTGAVIKFRAWVPSFV